MLCFGGGDGAGHPSNQNNILASASKHHSCQEPLQNERTVTRNCCSCFSPSKCCKACWGHEPSKTETFSFGPSSQWIAQGSGAKNKKKTNSTKMKGKPPTPQNSRGKRSKKCGPQLETRQRKSKCKIWSKTLKKRHGRRKKLVSWGKTQSTATQSKVVAKTIGDKHKHWKTREKLVPFCRPCLPRKSVGQTPEKQLRKNRAAFSPSKTTTSSSISLLAHHFFHEHVSLELEDRRELQKDKKEDRPAQLYVQ